MHAISLREFSQPVPACTGTDSLATAWKLFRHSGCNQLVIVDSGNCPLGILHLQTLVAYLFPLLSAEAGVEQCSKVDWQQSIQQASQRAERSLIQPIARFSVHSTIEAFYPYLQTTSERQWVLIDSVGRYVSLLDAAPIWQLLAASSPVPHSLITGGSPAQIPANPVVTSSLLVHLLEQLPLPLMLQTSEGQVIAQNLAWREQVGELNDPAELRQEAAAVLEMVAAVTDATPSQLQTRRESIPSSHSRGDRAEAFTEPHTLSSTLCQIGSDGDTCVCVCATKGGQERVWQFNKISLGAIVLSTHPTQFSPASSQMAFQATACPFQLAAFSPDGAALIDRPIAVETENLWLVLAQDTTQEQQVTKELAAKNADLIQTNRLKDEFLACISHELKTPLTAILGLSNLLKGQQLGELNDRQLRYAQLIYQSGRHLIAIVNNILDLTRIETGQLELAPEPVHIETVCTRAYEQAQRLLSSQHDRVDPDAAINAPPFSLTIQPHLALLVADEMRLRQMLANLIANALKFTPVQGQIGLTVESWAGWIAFTVWDTGIGIAADKQHLIFQKFQQLESPLTRQFEGTGLGLVLAQRLAWLHGGDITFTSTAGEGSQFTLLLPPNPPQTGLIPASVDQDRAFSATHNGLAIIVESTPQYLQALTLHLTELGYRVAIARSGTEALEKIRRLQPAIVFLNPVLPSLSGWDVLTLLKSEGATRHIPVVVTTTQADRHQAQSSGADGFLSSPLTSKAVQQVIERTVLANAANADPVAAKLTVLHLHVPSILPSLAEEPIAEVNLHALFHPHNCRVLEVDDLEQAELLARVWQPNVILLDGWIADPLPFLKQLAQSPFLTALPLVTLTPDITQAANQITGLSVFPCLDPLSMQKTANQASVPALLQVLQVAAGMNWMPHILVVDIDLLAASAASNTTPAAIAPPEAPASKHQWASWLQAFGQHTHAAGFRTSIGRSWQEIEQLLQSRTVDLLLICVRQPNAHSTHLDGIKAVLQVNAKPPILVWDCQPLPAPSHRANDPLTLLLEAIATKVLPASTPMQALLDEIHQALTHSSAPQ